MDIKLFKIRFIRPQHATLITEEIVKRYLHTAFYVSFIGWWQIFKWIEGYFSP